MQPLSVSSARILVGDNSPFKESVRLRVVGTVPGWRRPRVLEFRASSGCVEVHADDPRVGGFVRISHEDFSAIVRAASVESDPSDPVSPEVLGSLADWARSEMIREFTRFPAFSGVKHQTFPVALLGASHVL